MALQFYDTTGNSWTAPTMTLQTNGTAWIQWNTVYNIGSTTSTNSLQYNLIGQSQWGTWNETVEQKRERELAEVLRSARTHGLNGVRLPVERLEFPHLTDDEWRGVEDEFQRGSEERIEQERIRVRVAEEAAAARRKAELLLTSLLTAEQKREWLENKRVTQVAPSGRVWQLFPVWAGGATVMDGEVRRLTLCIHARDRIPEEDNLAALLTIIRAGDEDILIRKGILHAGRFSDEELLIRRTAEVAAA